MKGVIIVLGLIGATSALAMPQVSQFPPNDVTTIQTPIGKFTVEEMWSSDPDATVSSQDILAAHISFLPNGAEFPKCRKLRLIQTAQVLGNYVGKQNGQQFVWSGGQIDRNYMETVADLTHNIEPGFFVDHDASKCSPNKPCSPYFLDSWSFGPPNIPSHNGYVLGPNQVRSTSLTDYPNHWDTVIQYKLETCVVCQDTQSIYQCVRWGGYRPQWGPLPLKFKIFRPKTAKSPTPTFLRALALFAKYY